MCILHEFYFLELIGGNFGIFALLDDESKFHLPSIENFTSKVYSIWKSNTALAMPRRAVDESFLIRHFVTGVRYDTVSY